MAFDELAAAIVTLEPDDLPQLGRIANMLQEIGTAEPADSPMTQMLARATACVERIILREPDSSDRLTELVQLVTEMQRLRDDASPDSASAARPSHASQSAEPSSHASNLGQHQDDGPSASADSSPTHEPAGTGSPVAAASVQIEALASDPALLAEFVAESLDHVSTAEAALLALETDPSDCDSINAVFRAFHTIKGTSGFLGLGDIQQLAHRAETLLDRARGGQVRLTGGYADLALASADCLKRMIHAASAGSPAIAPADRAEFDDLLDRLADPEQAGLGNIAAPAASVPRVGDLLVAAGKADREKVEAVAAANDGTLIGQALVQASVATAPDVASALRSQKKLAGEPVDNSVRVSTHRLDGLINLVGELVITQAMLTQSSHRSQSGSQTFSRTVSQMGKITRELQDLSMSLRMVPLKSTFQKMARLVRDLCRKSGKTVHFVTEGEETEIDRGMVESLNDPLIHLIRNAVDHGIELPQARRQVGKPEIGTVTLRAYHAAGSVVIELCDDGAGLNRAKILAKAVAKGLVSQGRDLGDSEVYRLIFAPGFSTAEQVTDVSGRGVGMDVVRRNVEALRGRVDIATVPGHGTTFSLRVPLTLAIIDGMLLRVGGERYVLPTVNIRQAFRPAAGDIRTVTGRGQMVLFRGQMVPVFSLGRLFCVGSDEHCSDRLLLVVVENEAGQCALAVDELLGQQQVVIKSLGEGLARTPGVSGGAILGDGRVGLILDVQSIVSLATRLNDGSPSQEAA